MEGYEDSRLIDACKLEEIIRQSQDNNPHTDVKVARNHRLDHDRFVKILVEAPTVYARIIVHGKWEDRYGGKYVNPQYICSVCKGKALYKFQVSLLGNWEEVQALTPYCPHCGAEMDI